MNRDDMEVLIRTLDIATCVVSLATIGAAAYLITVLRKGKR